MAEYSRLAKGSFTAAGTTQIVRLPFVPDYVELWNYSNIKTAATHSVTRAWWDASLTDSSTNPTMIQLYSGSSTSSVFDTIASNGISTLVSSPVQLGAAKQIIGITKASQGVVNVTAHGYNVGDTVVFNGLWQSSTTGMPQIANMYFTIVAVGDADHFTIQWNTNQSNYTALSGSPSGSTVSKVLTPFNYMPSTNNMTSVTRGSTTTIVTPLYHNFEVGQEITFRIPAGWGTTELNGVYGYVTSITDNWTFVCSINSSGFTAYNSNQLVTGPNIGEGGAQVVPAGDVSTGGLITGLNPPSVLYPSPSFPTSSSRVPTINGPAVRGAFVNNTFQGFTIGAGVAAVDGTATLIANTNIVYWHAYLHDFGSP